MSSSSTVPAPVKAQYDLGDLPTVPSANPERNVLDSARLVVAKLVSEAWGLDLEKVFIGVDVGEVVYSLCILS